MLGELNNEEIAAMLEQQDIGRIGCTDGNTVYIVPVSYRYEAGSIICHSRDGLKIEMMRANPNVCFQVDDIKDYNHWKSVIAWGTYEELKDPEAINHARNTFSDFALIKKTEQTAPTPEGRTDRAHHSIPQSAPTIYYRIQITQVTGRFERRS